MASNNGQLSQKEVNNILNRLTLANRAEVASNVLYSQTQRKSMGYGSKVNDIKKQLTGKDKSNTRYFLQQPKKNARKRYLNKSYVQNLSQLRHYTPNSTPNGTYNTDNKKIKGSNGKLNIKNQQDYEKIQKWARSKGLNSLKEYISNAIANSEKKNQPT